MPMKALIAASLATCGVAAAGADAAAAQIARAMAVTSAPLIEEAAVSCWRSHGSRHCRWHGYRRGYRPYGYPDIYRYGSSSWWHEMDREERGGRR